MASDFVLAIINMNPIPIGATIIAHPQHRPNEYTNAVWTAVTFGAPVVALSEKPTSSNMVQSQVCSIKNELPDSPGEDSNSSFASSSASATRRKLDFDSDSGIDSWQNSPASGSSASSERCQSLEPKDFSRTFPTPVNSAEFLVPNPPKCCKWGENCDFNGSRDRLLDHLLTAHVMTQRRRKVFRCMWRGCRAYDRPSKKITWLEEHCRTYHGGPTPFHCIVKDCPRRFSTKALADRHIQSCLNRLELQRKKVAAQQQPTASAEVSDEQVKDEIPVTSMFFNNKAKNIQA